MRKRFTQLLQDLENITMSDILDPVDPKRGNARATAF